MSITFLRRFFCGLTNHDFLYSIGDPVQTDGSGVVPSGDGASTDHPLTHSRRVHLICTSCGYETPGWNLRATIPRTTPIATKVDSYPLKEVLTA